MNIFKLTLISLLCLFVFTGCIKKTVVTAGKIVEMAVLLPIAGVAYAVQQAKGEEETKEKEETKQTTNNNNQDVTTTQSNQTNKTNNIEQELESSSTIAQVQVLKEEDIIKTTEE